ERKLSLGHLAHNGIRIIHEGGQNQNQFPIAKYADHLRLSKISINFSKPVFDEPNYQCKGRTMEIALCGALLIEQKNPETPIWFVPGLDYVEFESDSDLLDKVNYYLSHETELSEIANNGCYKATSQFSAVNYWNRIFERLL
ncbi:MAG: glycosyltransferase, partial [Pseudomonadota bacterium]|nr:glycosyltransferase [Pseudomonadota bacterium]